jgi:CHAT domain-containing protein
MLPPMTDLDRGFIASVLTSFLNAGKEEKIDMTKTHASVLKDPEAESMLRRNAQRYEVEGEYVNAMFSSANADFLNEFRSGAPNAKLDELLLLTILEERNKIIFSLTDRIQEINETDNFDSDVVLNKEKATILERVIPMIPRNSVWWARFNAMRGDALRIIGMNERSTAEMDKIDLLIGAENSYRLSLEALTPDDAPSRYLAQTNLGLVLTQLGTLNNDAGRLRDAVSVYRSSLEQLSLTDTRGRANVNYKLGHLLVELYNTTRDLVWLKDASLHLREALRGFQPTGEGRKRTDTQVALGGTLRLLGEINGDYTTLLQAETFYKEALEQLQKGSLEWAQTKIFLGITATIQSKLDKDYTTIERARSHLYEVAKNTESPEMVEHSIEAKLELANTYYSEGQLLGSPVALRQASQMYQGILTESSDSMTAPQKLQLYNGEAITLEKLGVITHDIEIIRAAVTAIDKAAAYCDRRIDASRWGAIMKNKGSLLFTEYEIGGDENAMMEGLRSYNYALQCLESCGYEEAAQAAASELAHLLVGSERYSEARPLVERAIERSEIALQDASRSAEGRARSVELVSDLYGVLSLCWLREIKPDKEAALIAATSGRARLLAEALNFNSVQLKHTNDREAQEQIEAARNHRLALRAQLDSEQLGLGAPLRELNAAERARLQDELSQANEAYITICREHGLFLKPQAPTLTEIASAVPSGGALVLPVLTIQESFAFVVADGQEPNVIELPLLSRPEVAEHLSGAEHWLGLYDKYFHRHGGKNPRTALRWRNQLVTTLEWLWGRLLAPIHIHLRDVARLKGGAQVVLLAPGLLGLLPLHAAGPGADGVTFDDHWAVSYAPSVRALAACQKRAKERTNLSARLLAVLDPTSDQPLPGARAEEQVLRYHFGRPQDEPTILVGEDATLAAVMERLPAATCFHASTHGHYHAFEPASSGLAVADGQLTLRHLDHVRLDAARLVFMLACESGLADFRRLPEEFIGLSASFLQAGAACSIGSLWPIRDDVSFLVALRFYEEWLDEGGCQRAEPSDALRASTGWLRRVTFAELKNMFPVEADGRGFNLILGCRNRMQPNKNSDPIRIPLGENDEMPYADPEFWAAFTCTGA